MTISMIIFYPLMVTTNILKNSIFSIEQTFVKIINKSVYKQHCIFLVPNILKKGNYIKLYLDNQ